MLLSLISFCRSRDPVEDIRWVVLAMNAYAQFCVPILHKDVCNLPLFSVFVVKVMRVVGGPLGPLGPGELHWGPPWGPHQEFPWKNGGGRQPRSPPARENGNSEWKILQIWSIFFWNAVYHIWCVLYWFVAIMVNSTIGDDFTCLRIVRPIQRTILTAQGTPGPSQNKVSKVCVLCMEKGLGVVTAMVKYPYTLLWVLNVLKH